MVWTKKQNKVALSQQDTKLIRSSGIMHDGCIAESPEKEYPEMLIIAWPPQLTREGGGVACGRLARSRQSPVPNKNLESSFCCSCFGLAITKARHAKSTRPELLLLRRIPGTKRRQPQLYATGCVRKRERDTHTHAQRRREKTRYAAVPQFLAMAVFTVGHPCPRRTPASSRRWRRSPARPAVGSAR